jgi:hypothetical protein
MNGERRNVEQIRDGRLPPQHKDWAFAARPKTS